MTSLPARWTLIVFVLLGLLYSGRAETSPQKVRRSLPDSALHLTPVRHLDSATNLNFAFGLPLRHQDELTSLLREIYDPASARFHHYLSAREFAERFGPTDRDYQKVIQFASTHGLNVVASHDNRTLLDVRGSVAAVERALRVRMNVYPHPTEHRTFFAPDSDPELDLDVPLAGIEGLNDFVQPRPMNLGWIVGPTNSPNFQTGSGPYGYFLGNDFRAAYMPAVTQTGAGQSVGLFELDGYFPSDIAKYESIARLPSVPLTNVLLDGYSGSAGQNSIEVTLDIDMAVAMAPGLAQVIVYEGTQPDDILNRMATDNRAAQLSSSWGFGPPGDSMREQIYLQYAAQGQTMFQASGDSGAYPGPIYPPSDDANVTVVGGTLLTTSGPGGVWVSETAWAGSGGGVSTSVPIPSWQQGLATPANQASSVYRNIPDVAAVADVSIWLVAFNGEQGAIGGTSAATPLWAGVAALANQQAATEARPPLGFLNPTIYAIGRSAQYAAAFHDIIVGNNTNNGSATNFFAVPGYDLCTGWGSPAGSNLLASLITPPDALQILPAGGVVIAGGAGATFVLTNIGGSAVAWGAAADAAWLTVSPDAGSVSPGQPAASISVMTNESAGSLPAGSYSATVWFTNLNTGAVQSRPVTVNVSGSSTAPIILAPPAGQTAAPGATVSFTVSALGTAPLGYQWEMDGTNLQDGATISGSTNATLTVGPVSAANAGSYAVIVSNLYGSAASAAAVLAVASVTAPNVMLSNLYSFTGGADGANPNGLMVASNGMIYSTTQDGGSDSSGTVFQWAAAGGLTTLYSFGQPNGGFNPDAGLTQGPDGFLYGSTANGGSAGWGAVFKMTTNGALTTIANFHDADGSSPNSTMILGQDGNLYGTAADGGAYLDGEVFRVTPAGALTPLLSFDYTDGFNPNRLLQATDGNIYSTTFNGGNGDGTAYRLSTNGALALLYFFSYTNGGFLPNAGLIQTPDGNFYGTTYEGGTSGNGTVFMMNALGELTNVYSFGGVTDGAHPAAELLLASDGNLYGTTVDGGACNDGTVFRLAPGNSLVTLASFDGFNGANPEDAMVQGADGNLYGTTANGGAESNGVIFEITLNSPLEITGQPADESAFVGANAVFSVAVLGAPPLTFQWLKNGENLSGATNRVLMVSNVTDSDAGVYAVMVSNASGAITSDNAILEVVTSPPQIVLGPTNLTVATGDTADFTVVAEGDVPLTYQWQSNGVSLSDGGSVSGTTTATLTLSGVDQLSSATYSVVVSNAIGGATAAAELVVYPVSAPGTQVRTLYSFTGGQDGNSPSALVAGPGNMLYGTTPSGGTMGLGAIFQITTNGAFQTIASFDSANGANPRCAPVAAPDGTLCGTAENGGSNNFGVLYQLPPGGNLTALFYFTNAANSTPSNALIFANGGGLYGSSGNGDSSGDGNLFDFTEGGMAALYSFSGALDGASPVGALWQGQDGYFYGMTAGGGAHGHGGIFKWDGFDSVTNIYYFSGGLDGYNPAGALFQPEDGYLYGVTKRNVISNLTFYGTIFKVSTNGTFSTLYALNPNVNGDGAYPFAGLIEGLDGNLYGTTYLGGASDNGAIYRITTEGAYATLVSFNGADDGAQPQTALAQGPDGALYGTTSAGGRYGKGTIFRLAFTGAPLILSNPADQTNEQGATAVFEVAVEGTPPLAFQWRKDGTNLADTTHISGCTTRALAIHAVTAADAGTYSVVVNNPLGATFSAGATLSVETPPNVQSAVESGGLLLLVWSATPGDLYQLQSCTNLGNGGWANDGPPLAATNSTLTTSAPLGPDGQQFFRLLLVP